LTIKSAQHTALIEQLPIEDCRLNCRPSRLFNHPITQSPDHSTRGCAAQTRLCFSARIRSEQSSIW